MLVVMIYEIMYSNHMIPLHVKIMRVQMLVL
jgi:hypothetical protein